MKDVKFYRELANGKSLSFLISYSKGRGIYAHFTEVKVTYERGFRCEQWDVFGDPSQRVLLERVTRGSQKKVDDWAARIERIADDIVELWNEKCYNTAATAIFNSVAVTV